MLQLRCCLLAIFTSYTWLFCRTYRWSRKTQEHTWTCLFNSCCLFFPHPRSLSLKSLFKLPIFLLLPLERAADLKKKPQNVFTVPPFEELVEVVLDTGCALRGCSDSETLRENLDFPLCLTFWEQFINRQLTSQFQEMASGSGFTCCSC